MKWKSDKKNYSTSTTELSLVLTFAIMDIASMEKDANIYTRSKPKTRMDKKPEVTANNPILQKALKNKNAQSKIQIKNNQNTNLNYKWFKNKVWNTLTCNLI
jgi:hypothetical protein